MRVIQLTDGQLKTVLVVLNGAIQREKEPFGIILLEEVINAINGQSDLPFIEWKSVNDDPEKDGELVLIQTKDGVNTDFISITGYCEGLPEWTFAFTRKEDVKRWAHFPRWHEGEQE